ncbi:MAG: ATP-dependent Clp protease ATP-binding subunit ClpX, partial [Deinococcales bacterium]
RLEGVDLNISETALLEVAKRAKARGTGARALRAILEKAFLELMFEVPGSEITALHIDEHNLDSADSILAQAVKRQSA